MYSAYKIHFSLKDTQRLKVKEWKKILHVNGKSKRTKVAVLISGNIDVKSKRATKNKVSNPCFAFLKDPNKVRVM